MTLADLGVNESDEEVSSILQEASNTLPELRVQIEERIKEKTIH